MINNGGAYHAVQSKLCGSSRPLPFLEKFRDFNWYFFGLNKLDAMLLERHRITVGCGCGCWCESKKDAEEYSTRMCST